MIGPLGLSPAVDDGLTGSPHGRPGAQPAKDRRLRLGDKQHKGFERYTALAQLLHWLTAVLMLGAVVIAWIFMAMPDTAGERFTYITLHKSVGQTIFLLAVCRLIWRRRHPPPPMAGRLSQWEASVARWSHWLLYGILILMPLSGYILATAAARPSPYFWLFYWPQPPLIPSFAHVALRVHLVGQYFVYAFVGLHILGAAWHVAVRRDASLDRMLPPQAPINTGPASPDRPVAGA